MVDNIKEYSQQDISLLLKELEFSKMVHNQINKLTVHKDVRKALDEVVAEIGVYTEAEKAYIFKLDGDVYTKIHQWSAVVHSTDPLQTIKQKHLEFITSVLSKNECVVISDVDSLNDTDSTAYNLLSRQNIKSLILSPIFVGDEFAGFIGVNNAPSETTRIISNALMALGSFIGAKVQSINEQAKLVLSNREINDSRDMQREIVNSISCGVIAYSLPEHSPMAINGAAKKIIGCGKNDNPMEKMKDFLLHKICPEHRDKVFAVQKALTDVGSAATVSYSAVVNGRIVYVHSTIKLLEKTNGQKYILVTMLDVTEQSTLTETLAYERKAYRDALINKSVFTFIFDVTEGLLHNEFRTANGTNLIRKLGMSLPVSFDEMLRRYVETEKVEFISENMQKNFTCEGLTEQFNNGITNAVSEFYSSVSDIYIRTSCLMSLDEKTGHIYATVVGEDISEIRRKEKAHSEALKRINEKLANANTEMNMRIDAVLNGIAGGLKIIDIDNNYSYAFISDGAAQLQGYTVEEFLKKFGTGVTSNIYANEGEPALKEANRQIAETGKYSVKYRIQHKDGSIKWVIARGKLSVDDVTGKRFYYTLMQDITELEERNQQIKNALDMQKQIADSLGNGIFAYTIPQHEVLILNQEAKKMFDIIGSDPSNYGMDIIKKIIPEDLPAVRVAESKIKQPGDKAEYIFHAYSKNGELTTFKCVTKLLGFPGGQKYIISAMTDITEQELMEKRLDTERRQYRNALTLGCEVSFTIDMTDNGDIDTPIIDNYGKSFLNVLGLKLPITYDELAATWFSPSRVIADSRSTDIALTREKLIAFYNSGSSILELEYYVPDKHKYYHVLILMYTVNERIMTSFILNDITEVRHEEKLRHSVVESLGEIYFGLYLFSLSENTYNALKYVDDVSSDIICHNGNLDGFRNIYVEKYVLPEFKDKMQNFLKTENIQNILKNENVANIEFKRVNYGWCRITLVAADRDQDGNVISVVVAGTDIDSQKRAEFAQQEALEAAYQSANIANSAKTDFLANMSHDIRTPMNAIIGMTAIAETHLDDSERVADCLSKITVSSKHLLGIINEVLDMSKIESGKMELNEEEFNLPELIDNLLTMSKPDIKAKNHELLVSINNIEHEDVIGDSQRIQQVFMNLMSNAIKYTQNGGKIKLTLSEKPTNKLNIGCFEFVFEDNGIGMSEEFTEHLFEPFTRDRNDSRVNKIQGTGLGMPITKNIVQMMNGDIKVESKQGEGTKITVSLFLMLKNDSSKAPSYEQFSNLEVLVADDDESLCISACDMLSEIGIKSQWVLSAKQAVELVRERHNSGNDFFAVILDLKAQDIDGIQATKEIRSISSDTPLIIISAYDWSDIEFEARTAGANAFISKPFFKSRMVHIFSELVCADEQAQKTSDIQSLAVEDFSGKRALLVEDNELNAEIAGEILGMVGLTVEFAQNGKEAVDIITDIEDNYFDIIFMDIQMPVMNGYEAARAIRALPGSYTKAVPILAMTANAFADDVAAAKNAGMNEHIAKPLDIAQLHKALKKWLKA